MNPCVLFVEVNCQNGKTDASSGKAAVKKNIY